MVGIVVVTRAAVLIARRASTWTVDAHLGGLSPECVAVDLRSPAQVYCGTARDGLFRSRDSGRNWEPAGPGIDHPMITAVDVGHAGQADGFGLVYAGTEPSAVFRSDNGGDSWVDLAGLRALPCGRGPGSCGSRYCDRVRNRRPRIRLFAAAGRVVRLSEDSAQAMGAGNERPAGGEGHDGEPVRHSLWRTRCHLRCQ